MVNMDQLQQARDAWAEAQKAPGVLFAHAHGCPRRASGTSRTKPEDCTCWVGRLERALGVTS